jgi:hypothetical protein
MSRTFFAALALISLAACGGAKKQVAPGATRTTSAAPQTRTAAARPKARPASARTDTTTSRNPLTGH